MYILNVNLNLSLHLPSIFFQSCFSFVVSPLPSKCFLFLFSVRASLNLSATVIIRYRTPRFNKISGSYFLVFGKCGVTPHRLYRGSLTLKKFFITRSFKVQLAKITGNSKLHSSTRNS